MRGDAGTHRPQTGSKTHLVREYSESLREIWCDVLNDDSVDVDDNFFDIGGTSMLLLRTQREIARVLSVNVSLLSLFRYPTVRALAQWLTAATGERSDTPPNTEA